MVGMIQVMTWLLGVYLMVKGVEVLQIGLASSRANRRGLIALGLITLLVCIAAALYCVHAQEDLAQSISRGMGSLGT